MNETPDREKKIAEIREALRARAKAESHTSEYRIADKYINRNAFKWLRFLLSELERLEREYSEERAAHNAHVTELSQLEEEMRKLREERDTIYADWNKEKDKQIQLTYELLTAQQEIERLGNLARQERELADHWMRKHHDDVVKLREERKKLIEVLRWYADKTNYVQEVHHLRHGTLIGPAEAIYYDEGQRARDILHEIGVTVEWQKSANDMRTNR